MIDLRAYATARQQWATAVVLLVLAVHALMLAGWPQGVVPAWQRSTAAPLRVRQLAWPQPARGDAPPAGQVVQAETTAVQQPLPLRAPVRTAAALPAVSQQPEPQPAADAPSPRAADSPATADATADAPALPQYTAVPPSPYTLRYAWTRGSLQGHAELRWELQGDEYRLTLTRNAEGGRPGPSLGSASVGRLGPGGLLPERHTESRRGRDVRAANFQRDSERITFSGPRQEYPLVPGAQDRLSWIVQLPAILQAQPALQADGSEIAMFVVGSRGDGETWLFTVLGREDLDLPEGPVRGALHLRREPRRPYDTQAEVWLDPARTLLPVRLRLTVRPAGDGVDFRLEEIVTN